MYKLEQIKPIQLDDLVRCGNKHDGGYVLSQRQIDKTKVLLSFGINADWTFEYDFSKRNPSVRIYAYDYSTPSALSEGFFDKKISMDKFPEPKPPPVPPTASPMPYIKNCTMHIGTCTLKKYNINLFIF